MRGKTKTLGAMFSHISLEERAGDTPVAQTARRSRCAVGDDEPRVRRGVPRRGRPSVPPEMLLVLLLQILFSIRSERQLVEAVNYNLPYRWFVA